MQAQQFLYLVGGEKVVFELYGGVAEETVEAAVGSRLYKVGNCRKQHRAVASMVILARILRTVT